MRVGLFVTCLVDLMRPSVGFAALKLLEAGGAEVYVPPSQTCCGQPAYNSGDRATAIALARKVLAEFEGFDYIVAPSEACPLPLRQLIEFVRREGAQRRESARSIRVHDARARDGASSACVTPDFLATSPWSTWG